jgi:hypothetical protein
MDRGAEQRRRHHHPARGQRRRNRAVAYADAGDWPASADGDGYSLVRINPNAPGFAANWRTSTALGGNPGASDTVPFAGNPMADADGDGLKALAEHFLGTSDTNGASGPE